MRLTCNGCLAICLANLNVIAVAAVSVVVDGSRWWCCIRIATLELAKCSGCLSDLIDRCKSRPQLDWMATNLKSPVEVNWPARTSDSGPASERATLIM